MAKTTDPIQAKSSKEPQATKQKVPNFIEKHFQLGKKPWDFWTLIAKEFQSLRSEPNSTILISEEFRSLLRLDPHWTETESSPASPTGPKIKILISKEFPSLLRFDPRESFMTTLPGPADEPWVSFTKHDHFGLALSGGGIRSATFNLGLLQGLNSNSVLQHVDYLSTVSGGGYVGGFWTAWLRANRYKPGTFPTETARPSKDIASTAQSNDCTSPENRERPEFRHLREFSRFLMPRVGFTQDETWSGIVTILAGVLPSLLASTALVLVTIYAWFGLNYFFVDGDLRFSLLVLVVLTAAVQELCEWSWRKRGKGGDAVLEKGPSVVLILTTVGLTGFFWWLWRDNFAKTSSDNWLQEWPSQMQAPGGPFRFSFVLFGPAVAWSLAAVSMMVLRFFSSRFYRERESLLFTGMMDRCAYRCLALAVAWAGAGALWELSRWFHGPSIWGNTVLGKAVSGTPVVFGGLFLWLRSWLLAPIKQTHGTRLLDRIVIKLKPLTPQFLAAAAVLSFCAVLGTVVQVWGLQPAERIKFVVGTSAGIIIGTLWVFNPNRVGMHDFYRARIARCFLGAWARNAEENRATTEQRRDDLLMGDLPGATAAGENRHRPIHLVCCAANNLAGDTLSSLYRGCRSSVLSVHGVSMGNFTAELPELRFSSALTASAAAFNSQMGRVSMRLGPAVAMILSALNLRLGLWVPHPLNPIRQHFWFPGRFFFYEMFGFTKSDQDTESMEKKHKTARSLSVSRWNWLKSIWNCSENLHLSDGGHFENLGLYELIRRHCRYVIVSDCSADPEIAFDDLANTLRCVREDFGVRIELDVTPLYPSGTGNRSTQHAVVGTIHYDGLSGSDKGTILYFKPTLTGDEPADIIQYQTRNRAFPHESTGDQFYDEAQWESYRRLGEHAANVVLHFLQTPSTNNANPVENIFLGATQHWHPAPPRQEEVFIQLTERFSSLEAEVRDHAPASLRHEFFPEVAAAGLAEAVHPKEEDEVRVIYFVMLAAQVMEDAWV